MDFQAFDSSGTDDDLPPAHHNRISRGAHLTTSGRTAVGGSASYPRMYSETDMETEIHLLEQEAYSSVLRAFKAQADAITWEKESLITELRKELRLSNEEHRELLGRVNSDDVIRRIREWRKGSEIQSGATANQSGHDPVPSPTLSASRKKQKLTQALQHPSFGGPSPAFHTQVAANLPSSSAAKRGSLIGPKGKKHKSGQILPGGSATKTMQFPSSGASPSGRGPIANQIPSGSLLNEPAEAVKDENRSLIGRRVRTRWPDDNSFYEAVITNYDPAQGLHALVYDMGSADETWEWVNLSEISPEDIKWEGEDPGIPPRGGGYGGRGHGMSRSLGRDSGPGSGRSRGASKVQSRKDFASLQNGIGKKLTEIRILKTENLIKEVERVFCSSNRDPLEIDKAKKVLKDHEQALVDAIGRLGDITEG